MQIGIDLGATKIEYVLIDNDSKELIRNRVRTPNNYNSTISEIIFLLTTNPPPHPVPSMIPKTLL